MNYETTYQQLFDRPPPLGIVVGESMASILSEARGFVDHFDLTLQLNVGCPAGCLFCYVPSNPRLVPASLSGPSGYLWGYFFKRKRRALEHWRERLQRGDCSGKVIYWSGITDPYATPAHETQEVWAALRDTPLALRPRRMIVQTRFTPDRDAAVMAEYAATTKCDDAGPPVVISISIGTDRNELIRAWERATPSFERRMKTISALCARKLFVVATLSPFALWNDLVGTMHLLKSVGVKYVTVLFFKEACQGARTPRHFLDHLAAKYPQLLRHDWQAERIAEVESVFGSGRVLVGKEAFASLARPHRVLQSGSGA